MMQDISLAASFGRLAVVAALMAAVWFLLRRVTRKGGSNVARAKKERVLELVDRQVLGKSQSVAVFSLQQDYTLVVGVTEQRVELLTILEPGDRTPAVAERDRPAVDNADDDIIDLARIELDADTERFLNRLRNRSAR
jgi:flagellar biogenesis protein FliO